MSKYLLLSISILFIVQGFAQGPIDGFYKGQGAGSAVLGFGYEDSKKYYAGDMKLDLGRTVVYGSIFVDYGITQDLDASVSLPYIASDDNSDFQDMALWLKYRLFDQALSSGNLEFSVAGGFSTPVSDYELGGLNDIGQQATIIDLRGMVHYKINSGWFATLQSGYAFKLEETPNSIPVTLKAGHAGSNWYYDLYYDYQHSFGGIDYRGTPRPQNFREFGVDFHKVGGTLYKPISESFGGYFSLSYVLTGRNVFTGASYGLGLVYNFRKK